MLLGNLHKIETEKTPTVNFNSQTGEFFIEGVSIPEDTLVFYDEIFHWLDNYLLTAVSATTSLRLKMKFFNTSSSKCLFHIFRKLETLHQQRGGVSVVWYYKLQDTDMFEAGQDFKNLLSLPFHIERY